MAEDAPLYYDGWQSLPSGMDAGRNPSLIAKDQVALAINTTFRGGFPQDRPCYVYRPIIFKTDEERRWFETQIYQGSTYYSYIAALNPALHPNSGCLIYVVGGRIWKIDLTTYKAQEITPTKRNSRFNNIVYFCQARQYLIIQDGTSSPIIWDGSNTRRAGRNEVPVGTIMAYGQGRIWLQKGDALFAGDIEGTAIDSVLKFTEFQFLSGGGALNPGYVIGNVNGLQFIPQQDTATGVGTLLVFGERGTTSVFAELPRDQWINGIQRMVLINIGGTGHRSPCQINGDIWFRSANGLRSYRQARGQVEALAQLPLSTELDPFFNQDTDFLLPWVSSFYFDNRILTTISPAWRNSRVTFPAIAVCDFHILSSFGSDRKPAWDGLWTGINAYELCGNTQRLFAPGVDSAGRNCLFEILKTDNPQFFDILDDGERGTVRTPIVRSHDSSLMDFQGGGGGPMTQKRLTGGKYFLRNMKGPVTVQVQYRKDGETCYQDWATHSFCANYDLCETQPDVTADPCPQFVASPQYRGSIILKQPDIQALASDNAPIGAGNSGRAVNVGYEFQIRFTITGSAMLYSALFGTWQGYEPEVANIIDCTGTCSTARVCCDQQSYYSYTPELGPYYIPNENGLTPEVIEAQNAVINYLGTNPGSTPTDVVNNIPLPPTTTGPAIDNLIDTGQIGPGPHGGLIVREL